MHRHTKQLITQGPELTQAQKVMVMVHGRGATAQSILGLSQALNVDQYALLAPQANQNTWYPYSFMAPTAQNEPGLSSALEVLEQVTADILAAGFATSDIYLLGFSQGACLVGEYAARHAQRYGGIFMLSGGLIGETLDRSNYQGDFDQTPILLGCSDVDAHIPLSRVQESTQVLKEMGAHVTERIYPNAPHTVFDDEIEFINQVIL